MLDEFCKFKEWAFDPSTGGELGRDLLNQTKKEIYPKYRRVKKLGRSLFKQISSYPKDRRITQLILQSTQAFRQDSAVIRGILVVILVSAGIVWFKKEPSTRTIDILVDNLEAIAIASAGIIFILEIPDRRKRDHYEAWQVINSARGQSGSGGRIQALEDLNRDEVNLEGLSVPLAHLQLIQLKNAKLRNSNFKKANLVGANLGGANLEHTNLEGAILKDATFVDAKFCDANLKGANFLRSDLRGVSFRYADLRGVNFLGSDLRGALFSGSKLGKANFERAILRGANLRWANLEGVNLCKADLTGAQLNYTSLKDACLIDAILEGANLENCNLQGALLQGTNFSGANLEGVKLNLAIITKHNENAVIPSIPDEVFLTDIDSAVIPPDSSSQDISLYATKFNGARNVPSRLKKRFPDIFFDP